jgi:5-formyltetrahydrofolate cyclo-ligase
MNQRNTLRKTMLAQRKKLSPALQTQAASQICQTTLAQPAFQQAQHIGCYYPVHNEVNTLAIINQAWLLEKYCYLPVVQNDGTLVFARYMANTPLNANAWNIPEPIEKTIIHPTKLDIVLVPLLAFNLQKHRLGYGKGYYDKTFTHRKQQNQPLLIGLAYDYQLTNLGPIQDHDIAMDKIFTEKTIY